MKLDYNNKLKIKKYKVYIKQDGKYYLNPILYNRIINGKLNKTINNNEFFINFDLKEHNNYKKNETITNVVNELKRSTIDEEEPMENEEPM